MVGVDVARVDPVGAPVLTLELDFTGEDAIEPIRRALARPADAVLSDAAPKLTGVREVDRAALREIHDAVLRVSEAVLAPGGSLLLKALPGPESDEFRAILQKRFAWVDRVRPEGTRRTSHEFYWVAGRSPRGRRGTTRRRRRGRSA